MITEDELYEYWKKVYVKYGDNFTKAEWDKDRTLSENRFIYNTYIYLYGQDNIIFCKFTKKFWDRFNAEWSRI